MLLVLHFSIVCLELLVLKYFRAFHTAFSDLPFGNHTGCERACGVGGHNLAVSVERVRTYVCVCVCVCVRTYVRMYICMYTYICTRVYIYVYIYIYLYTHILYICTLGIGCQTMSVYCICLKS